MTATSVTSSAERPEAAQASAILARTAERFAAISARRAAEPAVCAESDEFESAESAACVDDEASDGREVIARPS